tara:strand:- start:2230 stop:2691 length:462 start_codon:yes stop_codon:yes gene_type:complete
MPQPKKRSPADIARVDELLAKAERQVLEPEDVKEIIWILAPFYDLPAGYIDGREFFFDANMGMLYEQVGDERHYILISEDKLSSFGGGGSGVNRGKGPFARLSADKGKLKVPLPEFPKVPANVRAKFPELKKEWEQWEGAVAQWVQYVQNQLS